MNESKVYLKPMRLAKDGEKRYHGLIERRQ